MVGFYFLFLTFSISKIFYKQRVIFVTISLPPIHMHTAHTHSHTCACTHMHATHIYREKCPSPQHTHNHLFAILPASYCMQLIAKGKFMFDKIIWRVMANKGKTFSTLRAYIIWVYTKGMKGKMLWIELLKKQGCSNTQRGMWFGVPLSGCTFLSSSFLSVTAWSDYSAHLILFSNKYISVWKFYWNQLPGGRENKTKPFS